MIRRSGTVSRSTAAHDGAPVADQVFVDASGRRGRVLRWIGALLGLGCLVYVGVVLLVANSSGMTEPLPAIPVEGNGFGPGVPGGHRVTGRPQRSPDDAGHPAADHARAGATGRAQDGGAQRDPETTAHDAEDHAFRQAADHRVADGACATQDQGRDDRDVHLRRMTVVWREHS
jgi:hypothetical protein